MPETINEALRLKSLVFWLDSVAKADELTFLRRFWDKRDYPKFRDLYPECPFCGGSPVFDPRDRGEPVVINGISIERVQCYCLTLEYLCMKGSRRYESFYGDSTLDQIKPIDVPKGAVTRTEAIKAKLGKFLLNPTRSALINGKPGCGKSHMLQSVKTSLGGFVVYLTLADYFTKLQAYREANDGGLQKFVGALTYAPILCLDDYKMQHQTDWSDNVLTAVIDSRYARRRLAPTLMTTNMSLPEMIRVDGLPVTNQDRVLSRMMDSENSTIMTMLQEDYRNKKTKKEAGL